MGDPEKVERLTDEQVAEAMRGARAVLGQHEGCGAWCLEKDGRECKTSRALLQVSADLSAAKEERDFYRAANHATEQALMREQEVTHYAAWKAAEAKLSALQEAARDAVEAFKDLRIDANRLCDRNLGGTYEADCRRSIADADEALSSLRALLPEDGR